MNLVVTELRPHEGQQRQQQLTAVGQQQQASCRYNKQTMTMAHFFKN